MIDPNFHMTNALEAFNTDNKRQRLNKQKKFEKAIKNAKSPSYIDLKKETDDLYDAKVAKEDFILAGAEDGRLKSEDLKQRAEVIKKAREKAAAKAASKQAPAEKTE